MSKLMQKFRRSQAGVTLVEYAIALILAIVVGGGMINALGPAVNSQMDDAAAAM